MARLDVGVRVLELRTPVVALQYTTTEREYQGVSEQIGRTSGLFFKRIREGWDVTRLNAEAQAEGGPTFTWHAKAVWYERYAAGELTADELSLKVLDTARKKEG